MTNRNGNAKITEADVVQVRIAAAAGERLQDIAGRHGVSVKTISTIAAGKTWQHVGGPLTRRYESRQGVTAKRKAALARARRPAMLHRASHAPRLDAPGRKATRLEHGVYLSLSDAEQKIGHRLSLGRCDAMCSPETFREPVAQGWEGTAPPSSKTCPMCGEPLRRMSRHNWDSRVQVIE